MGHEIDTRKPRRHALYRGKDLDAADSGEAPADHHAPQTIGALVYIVILCGLEIVVAAVLSLVLLDFVIPGSMREAMRYTIVDVPAQFPFIVVALVLACAAVRYGAEAMMELVLPALFEERGNVGLVARLLPRGLAALVGFSVGGPMVRLALDQFHGGLDVLGTNALAWRGLFYGAVAIAIGLILASTRSLHVRHAGFGVERSSFLLRALLSLIPLAAMAALIGTVLGLFPSSAPDHAVGMAQGAVERYADPNWETAAFAIATEALALFLCAIAARLGFSIVIGLLLPGEMGSRGIGGAVATMVPRLAAAATGFAAAFQLARAYAHTTLAYPLTDWFYGAMLAYIAIGAAASLVNWPSPDREENASVFQRTGGRWLLAADRAAALDKGWRNLFIVLPILGIAIFLFFLDTTAVTRAQTLGPVAVLLLWGFAATALFAPLAFLSQMTRMPLLLVLLIAGLAFAGFDLNDNHQIRGASTWHTDRHHGDQGFYREQLDLGKWLASRNDWRAYDRYPIFLVATEGGGIRAAYFTASVLDAVEQKCPGFAQHLIAISSVSGGSVGGAVFAAQTAGRTANIADTGCIKSAMPAGDQLKQARDVLATDLLSPLLGASLFPDAFQRILPVPVRAFDRARALEYALEDGWRRANTGCKGCDPEAMSRPVADLYKTSAPRKPVPHLFLNTTDAGTGLSRPFATWDVGDLAIPERQDAVSDAERQALPVSTLVPVQNRMRRDDVPLSTAAMLSARFPYLTPAAKLGDTGHYVDGGYFENSGTWLLAGVAQNLIGQRLDFHSDDKALEQAVQNAVIIVVVIRSEPCTRASEADGCDEDSYSGDPDSRWNEMLSPLRALLATRDRRAEYSVNDLGAMTALIQRLTGAATVAPAAAPSPDASGGGMQCNEILCQVTVRFYNAPGAEVPLTWMLSSRARGSMDNAVDRILEEDLAKPPRDIETGDRIEGSYRQVLCLMQQGKGQPVCPAAPPAPGG